MRTLKQRFLTLVITSLLVVTCGLCSTVWAAPVAGGTLDPTLVPKYVTPLVIPPVMPGSPTGFNASPQADHDIAVRQFKQQILPGGIWNTVTGGSYNYKPTTVWSYGSASDPMPDSSALGGGLGVAPAANSSFNYPAFTVENIAGNMNKVRWINELVQDPVACFYGNATGNSCNYLPHLLPVDQTLHWANPNNSDCIPHGMMTDPKRTDCETLNQLPYMGPVPIVTHVHGAHVNPESDGYPEAWWLANADDIPGTYATKGMRFGEWTGNGANGIAGSAFFAYENTQEPTTIWYHDHSMGMTRLNVYAGPAGFWLIRNVGGDVVQDYNAGTPVTGSLPGPAPAAGDSVLDLNAPESVVPTSIRKTIREIPIVVQDRSFDWVDAAGNPVAEGSANAVATGLWYPSSRTDFDGFAGPYLGDPLGSGSDINKIWNPEAFFNTMVVNGVTWPKLEVASEQYRFRLLNGCNSRTLNIAMFVVDGSGNLTATEVPFYQIGGDQGFLPAVTQISTGFMAPLAANGTFPTAGDNLQNEAIQGLLMMPAERADVIVDFTGIADGTRIRIINTAGDGPFGGLDSQDVADPATTGQIMEFVVNTTLNQAGGDPSTPVANLILQSETPLGVASNEASPRRLSLNEMISDTVCYTITDQITGAYQLLYTEAPGGTVDPVACQAAADAYGESLDPGNYTPGTLTGETAGPRQALLGTIIDASGTGTGPFIAEPERWMLEPPTTQVALGDTEVWELFNTTMDAHPIHVHLVRFEIVDREDININMTTGEMSYLGTNVDHPVLPNEAGFKDTVVAYPGQVTRLKAKFDILGRYVWHCHIVEHEDNEMMLPFDVIPATTATAPATITVPASSLTGIYTVSWDAVVNATSYVLEESTDGFATINTVTDRTTPTSASITQTLNGTFAYRVKAIVPFLLDSDWTVGLNGCLVTTIPSQMQAPVNGTSFNGTSQAFTWNDSGATSYYLEVGTTVGAKDISSGSTTLTSKTVSSLPTNGSPVYVRLWSVFGSTWRFNDYSYTAIAPSVMATPVNGTIFNSTSQTFTWNDSGATSYYLEVGTTVGAKDIGGGSTTLTSKTVSSLPTNGSPVYVRLWSVFGSTWIPKDYTYTALAPASISAPANGTTLSGSSQNFIWNDAGATSYYLQAGTSVGASNFGGGSTATTSKTISGLPTDGSTIYVRLWSVFGQTWTYIDTNYISGP